MPVPLGLPLGLASGAALAWLDASAVPGRAGGRGDRPSARAAAYLGGLVLGPTALYLELVAGAWANLYAYDLPSAFDLMLVIAVAASPSLGEGIAHRGLLRGDARWALGVAAVAAVTTVGAVVATSARIAVVASYGAFHRDLGGDALFEHRAGAALVGALAAIALGLVAAARAVAPARLTRRSPSPTLRS